MSELLTRKILEQSCGCVANESYSIDRLGIIAIRYRALIGEAMVQPFAVGEKKSEGTDRMMLQCLHGTFDVIEHFAQDFLIDFGDDVRRTRTLAGAVMDAAAGMKRWLLAPRTDVGNRVVPSIGDLELLYLAGQALGGQPQIHKEF